MLAIVLCVFCLIILVTFYLPKGRYQDLEDQVREQNTMEKILSVILQPLGIEKPLLAHNLSTQRLYEEMPLVFLLEIKINISKRSTFFGFPYAESNLIGAKCQHINRSSLTLLANIADGRSKYLRSVPKRAKRLPVMRKGEENGLANENANNRGSCLITSPTGTSLFSVSFISRAIYASTPFKSNIKQFGSE